MNRDSTTPDASNEAPGTGVSSFFARALTDLPGVGPKRGAQLADAGLATFDDLLRHFPRRYEDRRHCIPIAEINEGDTVCIRARVVRSRMVRLRRRLSLAEVVLRDDTGDIKAVWFGLGFLARTFVKDAEGYFYGAVGKHSGLALKNPDYELLDRDEETRLNVARIVPVYRLPEGTSQPFLRRLVHHVLSEMPAQAADPLPEALRARHDFPEVVQALRDVHFPESFEAARAARNRFAYDELLAIQLGILRTRAQKSGDEQGVQHRTDGLHLARFRESLPFALTSAQQRAVDDLLADMASPRPMVRLIQGDVGCGKTIVALHGIVAAVDGGYQAALMAPTEILAEQHWAVLHEALSPQGIEVALLTGAIPAAGKLRKRIAAGEVDVVVGTHALIQEKTAFHALGFAIVDEQHRFGVLQRNALSDKGRQPDILHMTATPIPRTLAITVYGGMDISVIDEMPRGRVPVKTRRIPPAKVPGLYDYIAKQAGEGYQTYIVCPLVEESDARPLRAVTTHYDELSQGPLSSLRLGLLHGRLGADEKESVMAAFKRRELDVLVATSVIEVGIDCPNATTMVIEDAGNFGLTQLHQLRGRVGRGGVQSHCFLLGKPKTPEGRKRIDTMVATTNGFEIAEIDLEMRGPGEFYGVRQAGLSDLHVADLIRDARLLDAARRDAAEILENDPALAAPDLASLAERSAHWVAP